MDMKNKQPQGLQSVIVTGRELKRIQIDMSSTLENIKLLVSRFFPRGNATSRR